MSQYLVRRRRRIIVAPANTRKHGGGGWLALGLIAAVAFFAAASWKSNSLPDDSRTLVIHSDHWNACHSEITIGNQNVPVLLDSGATGDTGLTFGSNQVAALGISPHALSYSQSYSSANGIGREAIVQLHNVRLHGWQLGDVTAAITLAPQSEALFGAQLLHRLNFRTQNGLCILTMPKTGS